LSKGRMAATKPMQQEKAASRFSGYRFIAGLSTTNDVQHVI
jgi:hypothetical protein